MEGSLFVILRRCRRIFFSQDPSLAQDDNITMVITIQQAITILNQGGVGIFPTDTAFGIGCRMDNEVAITRLFRLRRRPKTQATPVLVSGIAMAQAYLLPIPEQVKRDLLEKYWPGALTIVLPCKKEKVSEFVRGEGNNLGVRQPNHQVAQSLIAGVGVPLLGPSANFHGEQTPYSIEGLDRELMKLVDFVLPGECTVKEASTVINCAVEPWEILRQGAVSLKE
ncbi:MAG: L-threonylcarbamoyladenylate synthase [Patescibacteria group bacterium]